MWAVEQKQEEGTDSNKGTLMWVKSFLFGLAEETLPQALGKKGVVFLHYHEKASNCAVSHFPTSPCVLDQLSCSFLWGSAFSPFDK